MLSQSVRGTKKEDSRDKFVFFSRETRDHTITRHVCVVSKKLVPSVGDQTNDLLISLIESKKEVRLSPLNNQHITYQSTLFNSLENNQTLIVSTFVGPP